MLGYFQEQTVSLPITLETVGLLRETSHLSSILKVDEMHGVTSALLISRLPARAAVQHSPYSNVCKLWGQSTASGDHKRDSLNCSSMVDAGTGQQNWKPIT